MSVSMESRLQSLGADLAYPPRPDFIGAVLRDIGSARPDARRRLVTALAVAAVAVIAIAAVIPGVRETVQGWFGIGGVTIERIDPLDQLPSDLNLGDPATLQQATERLDTDVPRSALLGEPDAIFVDSRRATLVFGSELPEEAVLLTVFRGDLAPAIIKQLPDDTLMELATINGEAGIWISGEPHGVGFIDRDGEFQEESGRLAGNSLLWEVGVLTLRLEGISSLDRAVEVAESLTGLHEEGSSTAR